VLTEPVSSPTRATVRLMIYFLGTLFLIPFQAVLVALRLNYAQRFPCVYHRYCCRVFGFDVQQRGTISTASPVLFVSNHTSYIDIPVLGSLVDASFIAKAEISDWPFFGWLARLQRTVFVDRRGRKVADQRDEITARLVTGDSLVLFPEGTSGDGRELLPFKSALFAVAETGGDAPPLTIQPVSITYTRLDGLPLGRALRPYLSWFGDMTLMPHLFAMLGLGRVTAAVTFHPVLDPAAYPSRKALAEACRHIVGAGVEQARGAGKSDKAETVATS
ncbi:MAG: lysophospholipid acyltransferase family protein, partial [Alphaproteobacteria bacterium]